MAEGEQITDLAERIRSNTLIVENYMKEHNLPLPSFHEDAPLASTIPPDAADIIAAKEAVVEDTLRLNSLMRGPMEYLMSLGATTANDSLALQTVYRLRLFDCFEPGTATTFDALSEKSKVNVVHLRRLVRQAMTNHIFEEKEDGRIVHTAPSRALRDVQMLQDMIGILVEELYPSTAKTLDALQQFDGCHAPNQTGFALANDPSRGLYEEFSHDPVRGQRFAGAMSGFAARTNVDAIAAAYDWSNAKLVVDVGGGWGPVSAALAAKFPGPRFVVQDLAHVVSEGMQHVPEDVRDRLTFEAGDAFKPQSRKGADVYLFRHVLHNYPDESCTTILKILAEEALTERSIIMVYDAVWPEHETKLRLHQEKMKRSMDLNMLTFCGSRERTLKEWKAIIQAAHSQLELVLSSEFPNAEDNVLKIRRVQ